MAEKLVDLILNANIDFAADVLARTGRKIDSGIKFYAAARAALLEAAQERKYWMDAQTQPTVLGIDLFHGDGNVQFHELYAAGVRYAFLKATEGTGYADPAFKDNCARAKESGLLVGAYHFFRPEEDPTAQAEFFIRVAAPMKGDLLPALDVEVEGENVGGNARACANKIKELCGHCPIIYSSDSFFQQYLSPHFAGFTLWIARYGAQPATPCTFWQNADSAHLTGAPLPIDADRFFGTASDLQKYVIGLSSRSAP